MRKPISFPKQVGVTSRQAHADFPEHAIYEREVGRSGFFGPATHFHHTHAPTSWTDWDGPLKPRHFNFQHLTDVDNESPWSAPHLLYNAHCKFRIWHLEQPMKRLVRNSDGDDLLFIHEGGGEFFCDYGHLTLRDGDYLVIPKSTNWRLEPTSPMQIVMIEATDSSYQLPNKGIVGNHAIFDPACLDVPDIDDAFKAQYSEETWQVEIKKHEQITLITFPFNPLDAVGWHGDLAPVRINWRDFRPLMSHRYHLPPSAHITFIADRHVVCTFVPRPIESDPGASKVPFYHNNDDYDEVLFYHAGDFFSRDNIDKGSVTFHPAGFTHGPHPKAFKAGLKYEKKFTDEVALMLDTRDSLIVGQAAESVENLDYINSWKETK